jgi:hypothetical protein
MQRRGQAGGRDRLDQEMPVGDEGLLVDLLGPRHDIGVHGGVGAIGGEVGGEQGLQAEGAVVGEGRGGEEEKDGRRRMGRVSGFGVAGG